MAQFYYYDETDPKPYTFDHDSGVPVTEQQLADLGVFYRYVMEQSGVDAIAKERKYKNRDVISLSEETFPGGKKALDEKLDMFFQEHLHEDEEIRYILDGDGYFDVRDKNDKWVRAKLFKGDLLILPPGIYHRFTLSESKYVRALRLFKDEPRWTAHNRDGEASDKNPYRVAYLRTISA